MIKNKASLIMICETIQEFVSRDDIGAAELFAEGLLNEIRKNKANIDAATKQNEEN